MYAIRSYYASAAPELPRGSGPGGRGADRHLCPSRQGAGRQRYLVITSYSIHYTKLYDLETRTEDGIPVYLAGYLTLRVTEEFKLPIDVDLLDEARKLCDGLLKEIK